MKLSLKKLKLEPGDIVLVSVPELGARKAEQYNDLLKKRLPKGVGFIIKRDDTSIEKLSEIITPEQLSNLNAAMEKRLIDKPSGRQVLKPKP
jgi:hypothetical protein